MASDLARLFALAHDYHQEPALYQSRASSYDVNGTLYLEFIATLMNSHDQQKTIHQIAQNLEISSNEVLASGFYFLENIIFSADRNYYEILGLKRDVSSSSIRKRYRYLIALFHPDKCAACDIDGEAYSSLLNGAYNTLKKQDLRHTYDQTLSYSANINNQIDIPARAKVKKPVRKKPVRKKPSKGLFYSINEVFYSLPLLGKHPRLAVWGMMFTGFSLMVYLSNTDIGGYKPAVNVAATPTAIIQANKTPVTLIGRTVPIKAPQQTDYLEQTIQSDNLSKLLSSTEDAAPAISQASDTARVSVRNTNITNDLKEATQSISYGFDGGPLGSVINIHGFRNKNISGLVTGEKSVYSMPPELILMQFVQGYETGDLSELNRLFVRDVTANNIEGRLPLLNQYSSLFEATSKRTLQIQEFIVEPRGKEEALLISIIKASVQPMNDKTVRHYNGEMIFRVVDSDLGLQIAEIAHSVR